MINLRKFVDYEKVHLIDQSGVVRQTRRRLDLWPFIFTLTKTHPNESGGASWYFGVETVFD